MKNLSLKLSYPLGNVEADANADNDNAEFQLQKPTFLKTN